LFELNDVLQNHYSENKTLKKAEIELSNGKLQIKN